MKTMEWTKVLKPTRWRVLLAMMPFISPVIQIIFGIGDGMIYEYLSVNALMFLDTPFSVVGYIETVISQPFAPLLRSLGWWSSNGIFVAPNGPLLPGSFVVAITYSILLYIALSFLSAAWKKRRSS